MSWFWRILAAAWFGGVIADIVIGDDRYLQLPLR